MTSPQIQWKLPSLGKCVCEVAACEQPGLLPHHKRLMGGMLQVIHAWHAVAVLQCFMLQQCNAAPDVKGEGVSGLNLEHCSRRHKRIQIRNQEPVTDWLGTDAESWHSFVGTPGPPISTAIHFFLLAAVPPYMHASVAAPLVSTDAASLCRSFYRGNSIPEMQSRAKEQRTKGRAIPRDS